MNDIFEESSRRKLRFLIANIGNVSDETLWDISLKQLDKVTVDLYTETEKQKRVTFLKEESEGNAEVELKFKIAKYILDTRIEEKKQRENAEELKAYKQKVASILEDMRDQSLRNMSEEELQKELDKISM